MNQLLTRDEIIYHHLKSSILPFDYTKARKRIYGVTRIYFITRDIDIGGHPEIHYHLDDILNLQIDKSVVTPEKFTYGRWMSIHAYKSHRLPGGSTVSDIIYQDKPYYSSYHNADNVSKLFSLIRRILIDDTGWMPDICLQQSFSGDEDEGVRQIYPDEYNGPILTNIIDIRKMDKGFRVKGRQKWKDEDYHLVNVRISDKGDILPLYHRHDAIPGEAISRYNKLLMQVYLTLNNRTEQGEST